MLGCAAFKSAEFYLKFSSDTPPVLFSVKKCMMGVTESYKNEIQTQAKQIFENTIIRKIPAYLKKIVERYPASAKTEVVNQVLANFPHKDKLQIVSLLVYQRFAIKLASTLGDKLCPGIEEKVYRHVIDTMASLDVDIKIRFRKGTHLVRTF